MPAKNATNSLTTDGERVSANRRYIIDDGHESLEPRYCSMACSRDMAAAEASASASFCRKRTVYRCEVGVYICSRRVWRGTWTAPTRVRALGGERVLS